MHPEPIALDQHDRQEAAGRGDQIEDVEAGRRPRLSDQPGAARRCDRQGGIWGDDAKRNRVRMPNAFRGYPEVDLPADDAIPHGRQRAEQ